MSVFFLLVIDRLSSNLFTVISSLVTSLGGLLGNVIVSLETIERLAHDFGYWAVFLGISLENAGIPLPGETIVLVAGFLAGNGDLELVPLLASAIAGASLGNTLGYWLGRWGGWPLLQKVAVVLRISDEKLNKLRGQFADNAGKAVFLGRFIALLRMFAGPLAGVVEMPYGKFLAYNTAGAVVWGTVTIGAAYGLGRLVPLPTLVAWFSRFTLVVVAVAAAWFVVPLWLESRKAAAVVSPVASPPASPSDS